MTIYYDHHHAPNILCMLMLHVSVCTYSLKSIPNDRETFNDNSIYFCQKSAERKRERVAEEILCIGGDFCLGV